MVSYTVFSVIYITFLLSLIKAQPILHSKVCKPVSNLLITLCFKNGVCMGDEGLAYCSYNRTGVFEPALIRGRLLLKTNTTALYSVEKVYVTSFIRSAGFVTPERFGDLNINTTKSFQSLNSSLQHDVSARKYQSKNSFCLVPVCVRQTKHKSRQFTPYKSTTHDIKGSISELIPFAMRGFESFGSIFSTCCAIGPRACSPNKIRQRRC